jgi:aminoglycoside phosphotransferase (APT) family kinase protein
VTAASPVDEALTRTLVAEPPLRRWIGDRLPGDGPFGIERVTSGHSNEIFRLSRSGSSCLLRRPPRVPNAPGAHDMAREYRVLKALGGSAVPHAQPLLLCEDDDVIGAPFYVMSWVDGLSLYGSVPGAFDDPDGRRLVAEQLFDTLADLHRLDWEAAGLAGFGRPDNFTRRQVPRWMKQLSNYQTRELPDLEAAAEWLGAHVPEMQRSSLIHGDYGLHNVLYAPDRPVRLVAVVDWETATIGDPLIDIGYLLSLWLEDGEPERWAAVALPYDISGYPGRSDLIERYAARSGLDLTAIDWYRAMAQLKVACILEGGYARFVRGDSDDPQLARYTDIVPNHAAYALAITRGEA